MRRLSILISVLAVVALNVAFVPAGVAAQATPDAGKEPSSTRGGVPCRAALCRRALRATRPGGGSRAGRSAARTPVPAPPWIAADKETTAAAEATAREWVACINADDNLRLAALMSDAALTRFFASVRAADAIEEARADLAGTPVPRAEEERAQLVTVTDVARLDDGRIVALAEIKEPAMRPGGQEALLLVFTPVGERLLIDDIIQFSVAAARAATPVAGTPQP